MDNDIKRWFRSFKTFMNNFRMDGRFKEGEKVRIAMGELSIAELEKVVHTKLTHDLSSEIYFKRKKPNNKVMVYWLNKNGYKVYLTISMFAIKKLVKI
jgi:hypothetical protein